VTSVPCAICDCALASKGTTHECNLIAGWKPTSINDEVESLLRDKMRSSKRLSWCHEDEVAIRGRIDSQRVRCCSVCKRRKKYRSRYVGSKPTPARRWNPNWHDESVRMARGNNYAIRIAGCCKMELHTKPDERATPWSPAGEKVVRGINLNKLDELVSRSSKGEDKQISGRDDDGDELGVGESGYSPEGGKSQVSEEPEEERREDEGEDDASEVAGVTPR